MCREDEQDKLPNLLGRYTYLKDSITHPSLWPSHSSYLFQFLHQPRALCLSCLPDFYGAYGICKVFNQLSKTSLISFFTQYWRLLDNEIASTPMPPEYQNYYVTILCNDCHQVSQWSHLGSVHLTYSYLLVFRGSYASFGSEVSKCPVWFLQYA